MNFIKTLMVLVAAFFLNLTVNAQTFSPGFNDVTIQDGYGHVIRPLSNTHKVSVDDLGGEPGLIRTVERRTVQMFDPWVEDTTLFAIVGLGVDSFDVHFPHNNLWWETRVRYRLMSDPNVIVFEKITTGIQAKPEPNPTITSLSRSGGLLTVGYTCARYSINSPAYNAYLVFNIRMGGLLVYADTVWINPAGTGIFGGTRTFALYPLASGNLCVDLTVLYSHDGPGFSDFQWVEVGQSPQGLNCSFWPGLSTGVDEQDGSAAVEVQYAFDQIKVVGAPTSAVVRVHTATGQIVHTARASEAVSTTSWVPGIYLVQVAGLVETKRIFIGSGR